MHRLLKRQLSRYFPGGVPESDALNGLLQSINDAYENFSRDEAMLGHSLDISSQELNERNDTLSSLLDALPDTCIWVDELDIIRDIRLGQQLDGLFSASDKFRSLDEIALLKGQHRFRSYIINCRKNNRPEIHECQLMLGENQLFIETRFSPLKNKQVLVVFCDITVRKLVERLKTTALEESQRSGKQMQQLINGAPIGIMLIDSSMNIIMTNNCAASHLGLQPTQLLGRPCDEFIDPASRQQYLAAVRSGFDNPGSTCESRIDVNMLSPTQPSFAAELAFSILHHGGKTLVTQAFIDISARKQMERDLRRLAQTDPLTGVANRRFFYSQGEDRVRSCRQEGMTLCVLAMDLDHFKQINDNHGHATGDEVLKSFCRTLERLSPQSAIIGRFGGEEFTLLLPGHSSEEAQHLASRILTELPNNPVTTSSGALRYTTSIGIASLGETEGELEALLNLADSRLYRAKHTGRNRFCAAD
ncbi:diguanylate cyclase [Shewanella sp. JM162201]|uniref:Diguanylate cyclase n=1 Tax=Shewanella jiangmenensis TaxID=2837387 RepID=A0ABS5V1V8_9GAMM|nr:diguanylate cyclase [Shewanella jiangmenensis]MBT1443918.1 diguanylate cyclase [Shewanella jiangmenensis]